jgi:hypothetical protein
LTSAGSLFNWNTYARHRLPRTRMLAISALHKRRPPVGPGAVRRDSFRKVQPLSFASFRARSCAIVAASLVSKRSLSFATVGLVAATSALASPPFQMPSGNIRCTADVHNGQPSDIVGTMLARSGPSTTPRPPGCNDEWGYTFELGGRGDVKAACGGPITLDGGVQVLGYGRTWTLGGVICVSSKSGLECRNADGHGFFLSRARQSVF